jgi:hypothetical protein
MLLSPLFTYTFTGMVLAACGLVLAPLYNRRWTRITRLVAVVVGAVLLLCNTASTPWDYLVGLGASTVAAALIAFVLMIAAAFGLIASPKAAALAAHLGLVGRA